MMKFAVLMFLLVPVFLAGCSPSGGEAEKPATNEEAREKSVFWQMEEPRVQLDPIEEKEIPAVMGPKMEGEDRRGRADDNNK